jgi:hypothetical protein
MKKIALILTFLLFSIPAFADNWKVISSTEDETIMYDADSVKPVTDNAIIFTVKTSKISDRISYVVFDSSDQSWAVCASLNFRTGNFVRIKKPEWTYLKENTIMYSIIQDIFRNYVNRKLFGI